jgi:hypothetical protein
MPSLLEQQIGESARPFTRVTTDLPQLAFARVISPTRPAAFRRRRERSTTFPSDYGK